MFRSVFRTCRGNSFQDFKAVSAILATKRHKRHQKENQRQNSEGPTEISLGAFCAFLWLYSESPYSEGAFTDVYSPTDTFSANTLSIRRYHTTDDKTEQLSRSPKERSGR